VTVVVLERPWTAPLLWAALVQAWQTIHARPLKASGGSFSIVTGRRDRQPAPSVNLAQLVLGHVRGRDKDILLYCLQRAAGVADLSQEKFARDRYDRTRKWLNDERLRICGRIAEWLNSHATPQEVRALREIA